MTNRYFNNANRPLMIVVSFVAAMFLSACGGSGGGDGSRLDSTVPFSERQSNSGSTNDNRTEGDSSTAEASPNAEGSVATDNSETEAGGSDMVGNDSSTSEDGPQTTEVYSPVVLRWSVPTSRKNGEFLPPEELGGYEIRYREASESEFRTISISDALQNRLDIEELRGAYEFQIAAYDSNGLYSEFIDLTPFNEG